MRLFQCSLLSVIILSATSCVKNNCGGVDHTIHHYGLEIENEKDTIQLANSTYTDVLRLNTLMRNEDGDRNCKNKNLVFNYGELIDSSATEVYCDHEIKTKGIVVNAGDNLLKREGLKDVYSENIVLRLDSADVAGKTFTYYVKGNTNRGNTFFDSTKAYYE